MPVETHRFVYIVVNAHRYREKRNSATGKHLSDENNNLLCISKLKKKKKKKTSTMLATDKVLQNNLLVTFLFHMTVISLIYDRNAKYL